MFVGNGGGVEFTFDGEAKGVLGKAGKVLRVRFPAKATLPEKISESITAPDSIAPLESIPEPDISADDTVKDEETEETNDKPAKIFDEDLF
ncbi:MAG: hypothetical protein V3V95_07200 [Thermodesulfobacteriota bacterium]